MSKRVIETTRLMQPIAHFSHAARVGNLVYVGAIAGTDAQRRLAGSSPGMVDAPAQFKSMFENLAIVLDLLGATPTNLVQLRSYVADARDVPLYSDMFQSTLGANLPSHSIVGSWGFPLPQAAAEFDAIAIADEVIDRRPKGSVRAGPRFYCTALPTLNDGRTAAGGIIPQTQAALRNLSTMLSEAGMAVRDVVKVHVSLSDLRDLQDFETQYEQHFPVPRPARTVTAAALFDPVMRVQLECIAYAGGGEVIGASPNRSACQAMLAGDELFISGQFCKDGEVLLRDAEAQTRNVWREIGEILGHCDMTPEQVIRTTNVLTDWRDYRAFNAGYGASVTKPYPPRITMIAGFGVTGSRIQIEAVAHRKATDATFLDVRTKLPDQLS